MRVRLVRLVLDDVRNIKHGAIIFDDLETGGSITGVYGQNGSGKTSVIDTLGILQHLMSGRKLFAGSSDLVNADTDTATITATYRITCKTGETKYVEYSVTLTDRHADRVARIDHETLRVGDNLDRMGRSLMEWDRPRKLPSYVWRSLLSIPDVRKDVDFFERANRFEGASFLFCSYQYLSQNSADGRLMLDHFIDVAEEATGLSERTTAFLKARLKPAAILLQQLADHAGNDMHIPVVRFNNAGSECATTISVGAGHRFSLNWMEPNIMDDDALKAAKETINTCNQLLPTLVPNLQLSLSESPAPSDDQGTRRTKVEVMSSRGGGSFPFRNESEGIIRLVHLLPFLIRVYNNPDVLVAVDGIDAGLSEKLLGDTFSQLASGIRGQLVFTANNLRLFEILPDRCLRTTVVDSADRFSRVPKIRPTNNGRSVYRTAVDVGWNGPNLYEHAPARMFANRLFLAGHPETVSRFPESRPTSASPCTCSPPIM